jgi:arylsulfatase A-like enzyme
MIAMNSPTRSPGRHRPGCLAVVLVVYFSGLGGPALPAAESRPRPGLNFIVILIDDLGWRDVGCYGSTFYRTPHIDRLARAGMRFTAAYAACCVCSPTRASLLTGQYPARLHLTDYIGGSPPANARLRVPPWTPHLAADARTLPRALKPAGYVSACIGKWHLNDPKTNKPSPGDVGFDLTVGDCVLGQAPDYFYPYRRRLGDGREIRLTHLDGGREGEYLTERLTREAERFLEANRDRPFFLYLPHYAVHTAIGARLQARPEVVARCRARIDPRDPQKNPVYSAMVEAMDEGVGRLVHKLDALKIGGRTVIIFTSDNGGYAAATSNRPLRGAKASAYEGGVRVPLIVAWPGAVKPGSVCAVPVASIDLYPTILEAAGVRDRPDHPTDGASLVPLLRGTGGLRRAALFWHYPHYSAATTPYGAVRQGDFKLIEFFEDGRLELFNLKDDPGEKRNLAAQKPATAWKLYRTLADWRKRVSAQMPSSR